MYARLATYEVPEGSEDEARAAFGDSIARIRECPGLREAFVLVGTDSSRVVTITFWEDRAAMTDSRVFASRLRSEAAASLEGDILSVDEYEVVGEGEPPS